MSKECQALIHDDIQSFFTLKDQTLLAFTFVVFCIIFFMLNTVIHYHVPLHNA